MAKLDAQRYDHDLQMFVQEARPLNLSWLGFLRYLGDRGLLEHPIAGPVSGPLVEPPDEAAAMRSPDYTGKAS